MIQPEDVIIRYENMPTTLQSFVRENPDMSVTVVMNARCSRKANIAAYWHEIKHLDRDDLNSKDPADQIEQECH